MNTYPLIKYTHIALIKLLKIKNKILIYRITMSNNQRRVCASAYLDPIHIGHIEYLTLAKKIAGPDGKLVVIVNNDHQCILKKGKPFMPAKERIKIVEALRMVDEVWLSIDTDRTVCKTIEHIQPPITHFVNGGDQNNNTIPERPVCERLGVELVDGLGEKIQSSSWLTGLKPVHLSESTVKEQPVQ